LDKPPSLQSWTALETNNYPQTWVIQCQSLTVKAIRSKSLHPSFQLPWWSKSLKTKMNLWSFTIIITSHWNFLRRHI
jgi:hypothetical protein